MRVSCFLRHLTAGTALAALLATLPTSALAMQHRDGKRVEQAEIRALEGRWREAQLTDDVPAMEKLLSDEFLGVTASGQVVTKTQQLERMRTRRLALRRIDMLDTKVKLSGNLAVVTSEAAVDGTADGAPLRGLFRYTRVYQHTASGWRITNFEATRVDGPLRGAPAAVLPTPSAVAPNSHPTSPAKYVSLQPQS